MRGRISWPLYIHVHRVHRVVMFVSRQMIVLGLLTSAVLVLGCNPRKREKAVCQLKSALRGEIELEATTGGDVEFSGQISSLPPGKHGFHVHHHGDVTDRCKAAGGHFNPFHTNHGGWRAKVT